jgi:hypothetical protein
VLDTFDGDADALGLRLLLNCLLVPGDVLTATLHRRASYDRAFGKARVMCGCPIDVLPGVRQIVTVSSQILLPSSVLVSVGTKKLSNGCQKRCPVGVIGNREEVKHEKA